MQYVLTRIVRCGLYGWRLRRGRVRQVIAHVIFREDRPSAQRSHERRDDDHSFHPCFSPFLLVYLFPSTFYRSASISRSRSAAKRVGCLPCWAALRSESKLHPLHNAPDWLQSEISFECTDEPSTDSQSVCSDVLLALLLRAMQCLLLILLLSRLQALVA